MIDSFGDRMKQYERTTEQRMPRNLPIACRIDGKNFSKWTKGLQRPFDPMFSEIMVLTTMSLVEATHALIGYTQSDEISLVWNNATPESQIWFDGRIQKMASVLSSMATYYFNKKVPAFIPPKSDKPAFFDCRVWSIPDLTEAANVFVWRQQDAIKNSIQMLGQANFSSNELHGKHCHDIIAMLEQKGISWQAIEAWKRHGTFIKRSTIERKFTPKEIENLPEKHAARANTELMFTRHKVDIFDVPELNTVVNKIDTLFFGAEPQIRNRT